MAVLTLTYLFDVAGCQAALAPLVGPLARGDVAPLRAAAAQAAAQRPDIWPLLADHRFYPDDIGREEEEFLDVHDRTSFWLMVLIATFWTPAPGVPADDARFSAFLRTQRWDEREITRLQLGNWEALLLQPTLTEDLITRPSDPAQWPAGSRFGRLPALTGWLSAQDVRDLGLRLRALSAAVGSVGDSEISAAYEATVHQLGAAERANLGLFVALAD